MWALFLGAFVFPVPVAWIWGQGWLLTEGFHDSAGATIIHILAGGSALIGALLLGERSGKSENDE